MLKKQLALEDASLLVEKIPRKAINYKKIALALLLVKEDAALVQLTVDLLLLVIIVVVKDAAMDVLTVVADVLILVLVVKEAVMEAAKELVLPPVQNSAQALAQLDALAIVIMGVQVKRLIN